MSYYCSQCVANWGSEETDRGHCPTCGGDTVRTREAELSQLELAEPARMAARVWLCPDDPEQRIAAIQACNAINVDYIEALAKVMHDTAASAHVARRQSAGALRKAADRIYAADARGVTS